MTPNQTSAAHDKFFPSSDPSGATNILLVAAVLKGTE
jgi:hypothetical protein